jgi:PIN domain nuclease of toxin-antitoxin system
MISLVVLPASCRWTSSRYRRNVLTGDEQWAELKLAVDVANEGLGGSCVETDC